VPDPAGTKKTLAGGIAIEILRAAERGAAKAVNGHVVKLLYDGHLKTKDGKSFDKGDIDFVLGDGSMVIGFDRGVSGMRVGERRWIYVPFRMGYGKKGKRPKVPPNSDLWFDVTLTSTGCDWTDHRLSATSALRREAKKRRNKKAKAT